MSSDRDGSCRGPARPASGETAEGGCPQPGGRSRRGVLLALSGGIAAGGAGVAGAQTETPGSSGGATHTVDMTDGLAFEPSDLTIAPGDTVVWDNVGGIDHSVTAYEDEIPDGATYFASGGFDGELAAREGWPNGEGHIAGGETYEHTFETTGTYEYFCIPHEAAGMVATIEVAEAGGDAGGGAAAGPSVPDAAKSIAIASLVALGSILSLVYLFLKYGGQQEATE